MPTTAADQTARDILDVLDAHGPQTRTGLAALLGCTKGGTSFSMALARLLATGEMHKRVSLAATNGKAYRVVVYETSPCPVEAP